MSTHVHSQKWLYYCINDAVQVRSFITTDFLQLMIHTGVSGAATELVVEKLAHNDGYCSHDICGRRYSFMHFIT